MTQLTLPYDATQFLGGYDPREVLRDTALDMEQRESRPPTLVTLFIGMFAGSALIIGDNEKFSTITYALGVTSAVLAALFYFQISPIIPTPVFLYAGFLAWATIGGVLSPYPQLAQIQILTHIQFFVMIVTFSTLCQDRRSMWIVAGIVSFCAFLNAVEMVSPNGARLSDGRALGFLQSPNWAGLALGVGIAVLWAAIAAVQSAWLRVLFVGAIGFEFLALMETGSRGSFAAAALVTLYVFWAYRKRIAKSPSAIAALVTIGIVGAVVVPAKFMQSGMGKRFVAAVGSASGEISTREGSTHLRWQLKGYALGEALTHPIFGVGRNNFWQVGRDKGEWDKTAHDNFLAVLCETGFPGFALFYSTYLWLWLRAGKLMKSPYLVASEWQIVFLSRTIIVLLLIADFFDGTTCFNKTVWVLMALGIGFAEGLSRRVAQRQAAMTELDPHAAEMLVGAT